MPLSADLLALLNTCRATPADDLPRLVLADWLDEHDDPARADLIRVQCDLARPSLDTERIAALKLRERALIADHWRTWAGGLHEMCCDLIDADSRHQYEAFPPRRGGPGRARSAFQGIPREDPFHRLLPWGFSRGLLRLTVTPERLYSAELRRWSQADELGWLDAVRLPLNVDWARQLNWAQQFAAGLQVPAKLLRHLAIEVTARQNGEGAATTRHVGREVVSVPDPTMNDIDAAVACTNWKRVTHLTVEDVQGYGPFRAAIARANLSRVHNLTIGGGGAAAMVALLSRHKLTRLTSLDVGGTQVPSRDLLALARRAPRLNVLSCYRTPFTPAEFAALLASPCGETLHTLEVMNCGLGDAAILSLVGSGMLGRLYGPQLNLSMNPIADAGMSALAGSEDLLRFSELILRECHAGDAGVEALAASPFAANLRYLDLWKNRLTDRGAEALAASPHLGQVRDLNVRDNGLTERGRAVLTERYGAAAKVGF